MPLLRITPGGHNGEICNPHDALRPDGRHHVEVEFDESIGEEISPGVFNSKPAIKPYYLKRKNLVSAHANQPPRYPERPPPHLLFLTLTYIE